MLFLLPTLLVGLGLALLLGDDDDGGESPRAGAEQRGDSGSDTLTGGGGPDLLDGRGGNDALGGRGGDDTLIGGGGFDNLTGGSGDDLLDGGRGADLLDGGPGDDTLEGGAREDALFGGTGDDSLSGGDVDDELFGGAGDDVLNGDAGGDGLYGGAGNDTLAGGEGDDVLYGVDLIDEAILTPEAASGVISEEDFAEFIDLDGDPEEADVLDGGGGNDVLLVGANDVVTGGNGQDDFVLGDWVTPGNPVTITDFDPDMDILIFAHEGATPPDDVRLGVSQNGDFVLRSDAGILARLPGTAGAGLTPADLIFTSIGT